jgi:hypothetical protein
MDEIKHLNQIFSMHGNQFSFIRSHILIILNLCACSKKLYAIQIFRVETNIVHARDEAHAAIGVHSGRPARPGPSPKRPGTFNFGPGRPNINFGSCRAGPRADPSAHGPAHISLNVSCFKRAARNKKRPEIKKRPKMQGGRCRSRSAAGTLALELGRTRRDARPSDEQGAGPHRRREARARLPACRDAHAGAGWAASHPQGRSYAARRDARARTQGRTAAARRDARARLQEAAGVLEPGTGRLGG